MSDAEHQHRLSAAKQLNERREDDALASELEQLWPLLDAHPKYIELLPLIADVCSRNAAVRSRFEAIRDACEPELSERKGWADWLALNDALDDGQRTLNKFDQLVSDQLPSPRYSRLVQRLLERGRPEDFVYVHKNAIAELQMRYETMLKIFIEAHAPASAFRMAHSEIAKLVLAHEACGAGPEVRAAALALDGSEEMKAWLNHSWKELVDICLAEFPGLPGRPAPNSRPARA